MGLGFSSDDRRPAIVLFRSPLFNPSETFVQGHAAGLTRYCPIIVGFHRKPGPHLLPRCELLVPTGRLERLAAQLGDWRRMARRLGAAHPSVVHAHFGPDGVAALPLARALGIPLVTTLHGHEVGRSRRRLLLSARWSWTRYALGESRLARDGDLFLAVSDALRRAAVDRGFPPERTRTHYLGVDLSRFRTGGEAEPGLILHVGRLVEKKGTAVLIEAFARLRSEMPEARLAIVGEGPERKGLERRCARLGLGDSVTFAGRCTPDQVVGWMKRAWVLAVPSIAARDGDAEGLPTVLAEAAAAALPAVGTHHSGIPEAILDGETGLLVPERDSEALARRLRDLLGSPDRRARMGAAARALSERRFDAIRQTAALEAIYDELRQTRPLRSR